MDLFSLLEKNHQVQITILRFLIDENKATKVSTVMKGLSISRFVFDNNIEELYQNVEFLDLGLTIDFDSDQDTIIVRRKADSTLERLYFHYLSQSIDYKLLMYLFLHPKFSMPKLANYLSLGEAATYRRIKKINQLLAEFEITIKMGTILGSELQICYFFYELFWNGYSLEGANEVINDVNTVQFVSYLEKQLKQTFNHQTKAKLYLWIRILKRRISIQDTNSETANDLIKKFLTYQADDPLYLIIRDAYFLSLSHSAIFGSDLKAIYLYFFVSSVFIITPENDFYQDHYWPTQNEKVISLNNLVVSKVESLYHITTDMIDVDFVTNWKYILTQIHGKLVYFKGNITFFDEDFLFSHLMSPAVLDPTDFQMAHSLLDDIEQLLGTPIPEASKQLFSRVHLHFYYEMRHFTLKKIQIGVCYTRSYLQSQIAMQNIQSEFETKFPISCEIAKAGKHYDLLVANSKAFLEDYPHELLYIVNNVQTPADTIALTSLLNQLFLKESSR